jgi:hypothetical protein
MSIFKEKLELEIEEAELQAQKKFSGFPAPVRWMIIICAIALLPAYFISKSVSAKYWTNQYSRYVLAAKPSFSQALPPKISKILLISQAAENFSALTSVSNENLDLSLDETPYQINFFNDKNEQVYTATGKIFLLPNQKKDIIVPKFSIKEKIVSAQLVLPTNLPWQKRADLSKVSLVASPVNHYYQYDPLALAAEGNIYNNSPYNIKQIHLTFEVTDSSGQVIAVSQRDEFSIKPFERRAYKQLWPDLYNPGVNAVLISADTNILDPSNLDLPSQQPTPASDLSRPTTDQP